MVQSRAFPWVCLLLTLLSLAPFAWGQAQSQAALISRTNALDAKQVLRSGDSIEVQVFGEEELRTKGQIDPNGLIALALVGKIKVAGLTSEEAASVIRQAYMVDYLVNPSVTVQVNDFAKNRVTVLGQVKAPGVYQYSNTESLNILQAIAKAGGYTRLGEPSKILVKRLVNGRETTIKLNAKAMANDAGTEIFIVQPEDTITVGETLF